MTSEMKKARERAAHLKENPIKPGPTMSEAALKSRMAKGHHSEFGGLGLGRDEQFMANAHGKTHRKMNGMPDGRPQVDAGKS